LLLPLHAKHPWSKLLQINLTSALKLKKVCGQHMVKLKSLLSHLLLPQLISSFSLLPWTHMVLPLVWENYLVLHKQNHALPNQLLSLKVLINRD